MNCAVGFLLEGVKRNWVLPDGAVKWRCVGSGSAVRMAPSNWHTALAKHASALDRQRRIRFED